MSEHTPESIEDAPPEVPTALMPGDVVDPNLGLSEVEAAEAGIPAPSMEDDSSEDFDYDTDGD